MEAGDGVIESGTVLDVQESSLVWLAVDADCELKSPLGLWKEELFHVA